MNRTTAMAWTAAAVVVFSVGCANREQDRAANDEFRQRHERKEDFFQPSGVERVSAFADVQAANGARNDAMLYPHHFDAGQLNSLGRSKVLLMLEQCESCEPVTVYLVNCGQGELLAQRKGAVELYLKTAEGPNPAVRHPAAPLLARIPKTELGEVNVETIESSADGFPGLTGGPPTGDMK